MSSGQDRPTGRQARTAGSGMGDPRPAGAHSAGYQEEQQGYPSDTVDYGDSGQRYPSESASRGASGQGYPPESAQYGRPEGRRAGARAYPEDRGYDERGRAGEPSRHVGGAALTILTGLLMAFVGIVGIIKGTFFAVVGTYPFYYSVRSRGITEIVIGAVLIGVGLAVLLGMHWARNVAIAVLVISAIVSFLFIPFYPFWSILLLALSVVSIWELGHHRQRELA
jgi:hypothetical protein